LLINLGKGNTKSKTMEPCSSSQIVLYLQSAFQDMLLHAAQ